MRVVQARERQRWPGSGRQVSDLGSHAEVEVPVKMDHPVCTGLFVWLVQGVPTIPLYHDQRQGDGQTARQAVFPPGRLPQGVGPSPLFLFT